MIVVISFAHDVAKIPFGVISGTDTNTPGLHDPEVAVDRQAAERLRELLRQIKQQLQRWPCGQAQDDNAASRRIKAHGVSEVGIERHEDALLAAANAVNGVIIRPRQTRLKNGLDIVSGLTKQSGNAPIEILIEFELHAGKSTNRSRDTAAP
jgi:hypothetical protein